MITGNTAANYGGGGSSATTAPTASTETPAPTTPTETTTPTAPVETTAPTATASGSSGFSDVTAGAWYESAVSWAAENKVMSGYGDGSFGPNDETSRAMLATILWNLEDKPAYVGGSEYNDVDAEQWYASAVRWASGEGIVTGYDDPNGDGRVFGPNSAVTREQLAVMLYRYAKYKGVDVSGAADLSGFADAESVSEYAKDAMAWARAAGLINGSERGGERVLEPDAASNRAAVAAILMRYRTEAAK